MLRATPTSQRALAELVGAARRALGLTASVVAGPTHAGDVGQEAGLGGGRGRRGHHRRRRHRRRGGRRRWRRHGGRGGGRGSVVRLGAAVVAVVPGPRWCRWRTERSSAAASDGLTATTACSARRPRCRPPAHPEPAAGRPRHEVEPRASGRRPGSRTRATASRRCVGCERGVQSTSLLGDEVLAGRAPPRTREGALSVQLRRSVPATGGRRPAATSTVVETLSRRKLTDRGGRREP